MRRGIEIGNQQMILESACGRVDFSIAVCEY